MRAPVDKTSAFLTGWKAKARTLAFEVPEKAGLRLERLEDTATFVDDGSTTSVGLMNRAATVPGMVSYRRGMYYYFLAYAGVPGDIVELGCWQGRSTTFLAQACKDRGDGVVHAVDTFQGNPGNESSYVVGAADRSDLLPNFEANMARLGLSDVVKVYPGAAVERAPDVLAAVDRLRMLVVDAEHTYEAVRAELEHYAAALEVGGLLVFDDYSKDFEGVARAVNEHLDAAGCYAKPLQDSGMLVARRIR